MKTKLVRLGLIAGALALGGFLLVASGVIPVKASAGHWPITEWFLRFAMKRSITTHSLGLKAPDLSDPALVLEGATHYAVGCASCHGEPGLPLPRTAARMLPPPPELASRIRESTPGRLFYVVKHGIKFTGMPAWPAEHRDDEVWAMVAFLQKFPELDAAGYQRLAQGESPAREALETIAPSVGVPVAEAQACARCHGQDGQGRNGGAFPRLAGQRTEYLRNALEAFATGKRHSGTMEPVAAALTPETAERLLAHYAGLPAQTRAVAGAPSSEAIERGRAIAHEGIRSQRVPACIECHGPGAKRGKPSYPALAGQPAKYLERQLLLFKEERRGGSSYAHLMRSVATRLTSEQMRDVARYFESLSPANSGDSGGEP
jgi:cytochrome c553